MRLPGATGTDPKRLIKVPFTKIRFSVYRRNQCRYTGDCFVCVVKGKCLKCLKFFEYLQIHQVGGFRLFLLYSTELCLFLFVFLVGDMTDIQ